MLRSRSVATRLAQASILKRSRVNDADTWPAVGCSAPVAAAPCHEQRAAPSARAAQAAPPAPSRSRHRTGTGSCSASRPRPATSPPPSTRPTTSRSCTRRSTTPSSSIDHSGAPLPGPRPRPARRLGRGRRRRRRARHARAALPRAAGLDRPAVRDAARARPPRGAARPRASASGGASPPQLLAQRANDGSGAAPVPFQPGTEPGRLPAHAAGLRPAGVHPLAAASSRSSLRRANQFRPAAAAGAHEPEVRRRASTRSRRSAPPQGSTRTPDQTQIGLFWNPPIWATWNRIAQTAALAHHGDAVRRTPRTFAALNLTFADSMIAFYDAKYAYRLWRPVTAIRARRHRRQPGHGRRPDWTPLSNTAPDPSYPGAHGTISAAGADVLALDLRQRRRLHRHLAGAAGRRALVRRASPRPRRRRASAASTTATTRASTRSRARTSATRWPTPWSIATCRSSPSPSRRRTTRGTH